MLANNLCSVELLLQAVGAQGACQQLQIILQDICSLSDGLAPQSSSSLSTQHQIGGKKCSVVQLVPRTLKRETAAGLFAYHLRAVGKVTWRTLIMGQIRSASPGSRTSHFLSSLSSALQTLCIFKVARPLGLPRTELTRRREQQWTKVLPSLTLIWSYPWHEDSHNLCSMSFFCTVLTLGSS